MSLQDIVNFHQVSDQVLTGGQPTEDQLRAAAAEGVRLVINLATHDARRSLRDEADLAQRLGLEYHHIPVDWERPLPSDYAAFAAVMRAASGKRVLIHCALNYRVTAFYGLYAMEYLGWSEAQADALRAPIWSGGPFPVWEAFIQERKAEILGSRRAAADLPGRTGVEADEDRTV